MSARHAYQLPFGAELIAAERTRFRLWAPDLAELHLAIDGLAPIAMHRVDDGFFECEAPCAAGARYRYRINAKLAVPDPASRCQDGDAHDASVVWDANEFRWRCTEWRGRPWHAMVICEVHVGCLGGFSGVEQCLAELAALGITAIELMPIADFSGCRNWGYDGVLPFAPDSAYGTPVQLKHLIDSAHRLGLCVYLDVVYNHFGPDGNFLASYAAPFFAADKSSPWGAAINFSQPQVREFFIHNALYWLLEYRFDGLRFDAVHQIGDSTWLDEMAVRIRATIESDRHVHLMLENEHNRAEHLRGYSAQPGSRSGDGLFDAQWNDDGHNVLHVLMTGERESYYANYRSDPAAKLARCLAEGFIYQGELAPVNQRRRGTPSAHLPPSAFVLFLQNHDQIGNRAFGERLTTLVAEDAMRAAITLLLLCPQIPLLFMGEEWGARTPFLFFTDFHAELATAVRDGRRREFAALAAFADPLQREQIPDPNALTTFSASIPRRDPTRADEHGRYLQLYRQLLMLRRDVIVPGLPACRSLGAEAIASAAVVARWQLGNGDVLTIAANFGADSVAASVTGTLLFASDTPVETAPPSHPDASRLHTLPAHCTRVHLHAANAVIPA